MLGPHIGQWGPVDLATHYRLNRRWRPWHPFNVTFLAKKNHDEHFFAGTLDITLDKIDRAGVRRIAQSNATVQIWPLNDLIAPRHVSQLFAIFQHSRPGCAEVVKLEQSW